MKSFFGMTSFVLTAQLIDCTILKNEYSMGYFDFTDICGQLIGE